MNRYVIGRASTGEILRSVSCDSSQLDGQVLAGEVLDLSDDAEASSHYFAGGALVAYTPEQAAAKARRPADCVWSNATMAWKDQRSLDQARMDRWQVIKAQRTAREFGGFTWDGSTFDSDTESQSRIQGAAQLATLAKLAGQPFEVDWTLADNSVRTLSGDDMLAVGQAMGRHVMAVHGAGRALRARIESAETLEEVEAATWPV